MAEEKVLHKSVNNVTWLSQKLAPLLPEVQTAIFPIVKRAPARSHQAPRQLANRFFYEIQLLQQMLILQHGATVLDKVHET